MDELHALVRKVQSSFVRSAEPHRVFDALLPDLLRITASEYGYIAEVWRTPEGAPYLKVFTMTNIAWDDASRAMVERNRVSGIEFRNLRTLFGAALLSGEPVIANDAPNDPRSGGGLPAGHSPLDTFLGLPLHYGGEMVGMIGLANRRTGYDEALLRTLDPLFQSMAGIIAAVQLDRQRHQAETALRAGEAHWLHCFEVAGVGIAQCGADGRLREVNAQMCELTGRPREALIGVPFRELTHPDDVPEDAALLARIVSGATPRGTREKRYIRPDGSVIWVQVTVAPVCDADGRFLHTFAAVLDIDQRKRAEAALAAREALFSRLASHVPGVLFQFHFDAQGAGSVPYASDALRELFELEPADVRLDGRLMMRRVVPAQRKAVWASIDAALKAGRNWQVELEVELPARGRRCLQAQAKPQPLPDGTITWHGYISDVTEHKRYEEALVAARGAERANEAKTEFLSRMSHELRTPLNAVLGFAQLLRSDPQAPLDAGQRTRVGHIERAGQHLLAMIGDVLDVSRIEAGSMPLAPQPLALRPLVEEACALVAPTARANGVTLQPPAGDASLHVHADPMRLRQVLANLLSNAVKYNRSGGHARVEMSAPDRERVRIAVVDTGVGLTSQQHGQLFQPFNRLGAERRGIEGTGLGLTITRRLLELMGGSIEVHSEPGQGSVFAVTLPRSRARGGAAADVSPSPGVAGLEDEHPEHVVLYAEDNRLNIELVSQLLELRSGCELRVAHNGREAIASARAAPPDLLLIDMHLGDMTGIDVIRALRDEPALAGVPRIALSADAMPERQRAAREQGFDDYLTKPVDMAELLGCLDRHLARRRA
jgi:PAS domain S-box-containing protein